MAQAKTTSAYLEDAVATVFHHEYAVGRIQSRWRSRLAEGRQRTIRKGRPKDGRGGSSARLAGLEKGAAGSVARQKQDSARQNSARRNSFRSPALPLDP